MSIYLSKQRPTLCSGLTYIPISDRKKHFYLCLLFYVKKEKIVATLLGKNLKQLFTFKSNWRDLGIISYFLTYPNFDHWSGIQHWEESGLPPEMIRDNSDHPLDQFLQKLHNGICTKILTRHQLEWKWNQPIFLTPSVPNITQ